MKSHHQMILQIDKNILILKKIKIIIEIISQILEQKIQMYMIYENLLTFFDSKLFKESKL